LDSSTVLNEDTGGNSRKIKFVFEHGTGEHSLDRPKYKKNVTHQPSDRLPEYSDWVRIDQVLSIFIAYIMHLDVWDLAIASYGFYFSPLCVHLVDDWGADLRDNGTDLFGSTLVIAPQFLDSEDREIFNKYVMSKYLNTRNVKDVPSNHPIWGQYKPSVPDFRKVFTRRESGSPDYACLSFGTPCAAAGAGSVAKYQALQSSLRDEERTLAAAHCCGVGYALVEYCCSDKSELCSDRYVPGTGAETYNRLIRLTQTVNMACKSGLEYAQRAIRPYDLRKTLLWASVPCTGGTPWQHVNKHIYPKTHSARIQKHDALFRLLVRNFEKLAEQIDNGGGIIAWEWPTVCTWWKRREVVRIVKKFRLVKVDFNGCMLGLKSPKGNPIFKKWTVATNSPEIVDALSGCKCHRVGDKLSCGAVQHEHARGQVTKLTYFYPHGMTDKIHKALNVRLIIL